MLERVRCLPIIFKKNIIYFIPENCLSSKSIYNRTQYDILSSVLFMHMLK